MVAEIDGHVVGHAMLDPMDMAATAHVFHLTVVVHPGHTGRGIGRALMNDLLAWAESNARVSKIELRARATNKRAIRLYQQLGFVEEGRFRGRVRLEDGTLVDDVAMAWWPKRLQPPHESARRAAASGLLHLNLNVRDVARAEHFYTEALGFVRVADTSEEIERKGKRFFLQQIVVGRPGCRDLLALSQAPDAPVGPAGMNHFGVVVADDREVELILGRATGAGGSIVDSGRRSHEGVEEAYAYVRDPDGYTIEVSTQRIVYSMDSR